MEAIKKYLEGIGQEAKLHCKGEGDLSTDTIIWEFPSTQTSLSIHKKCSNVQYSADEGPPRTRELARLMF